MRLSRSGSSPVMVGRDAELRRLAQLLDSPQPQVAIVAGEPGIGKSRLLQELVAVLPPGTRVLVGQADPGALSRPFELLLDAIDSESDERERDRNERDRNERDRNAAGGGVDPALLEAVTDTNRSIVDRLRAGLQIVQFLTGRGPTVLVFEDLHWADSESVALFERVAGQPHGPRLLIGTYRPDEINRRHPVADLLTRLERRHTITHLWLDRFGLADTSAFLAAVTGRTPTYRAAMALHNRTGGNPFFLEELLRAGGSDNVDELCSQPLPWNLAEALRHQVDDLDAGAQRIVEAAAVLGRKVPFDLLAAVTGSTEEDLIATLRDLVRRGLMTETGDDEFGFRHALAREAIVDEMLGRERRRLHALALESLLGAGSTDWALVAHHAKGAGRYEDMVAAARRGCARYLSIGSPYQALQLAETGLDEAPEDVDLLAGAARAAWLVGLLDDADRYARRWQRAAGTPDARAAALRLLVRLAWECDRFEDMESLTDEIEEVVTTLPRGPAQAKAVATVAQSYMLRDRVDEAVAWADRAIALADELGLPSVRLAARVEKGSALLLRGSTAEDARKLLAEAADEAEDTGDWLLAARAINNLVNSDQPPALADIAPLLERMRANAERAGMDALAVAAYYQGRARLAMLAGDLAAATAAVAEGRRHDRGLLRTSQGSDYHGMFLAGLALEAGDDKLASEILAGVGATHGKLRLAVAGLDLHLACRLGELDRANAALDTVLGLIEVVGRPGGDHVHDLVTPALAAGLDADRVRRLAAQLDEEPVDGWRRLVEAQLAEAAGDAGEALAGYLFASADAAVPPAPRGTAHAGAARCLITLDRPAEAREHVLAAGELLSRWGGWRMAQVTALRRRVGLPAAEGPAEASGPGSLTPREREVAVLLAEGLTNAELATRLYISPRTAAVHVSNILAKLGLSSRTQVAAWVRRSGVTAGH